MTEPTTQRKTKRLKLKSSLGGTVYFHSVNLAVSHIFLQNIRKWGVAQDFHSVVPLAYTSNWPVSITGFNINTRDLWFMTHHLVEVNLCFCYLVTLLQHSHRHDGLFNGSWFMEDKLLNNMQNPIFMYSKLFICHSSLPFSPLTYLTCFYSYFLISEGLIVMGTHWSNLFF